jgi:hypothetical protein
MIFLMDIVIIQQDARNLGRVDSASALEQVIMLVASHVGHHLCCCPIVDPRWSFSSQLLSIPFLWRRLPLLKKVSNSLKFVFDHSFFFVKTFHMAALRFVPRSVCYSLVSLKSYYKYN